MLLRNRGLVEPVAMLQQCFRVRLAAACVRRATRTAQLTRPSPRLCCAAAALEGQAAARSSAFVHRLGPAQRQRQVAKREGATSARPARDRRPSQLPAFTGYRRFRARVRLASLPPIQRRAVAAEQGVAVVHVHDAGGRERNGRAQVTRHHCRAIPQAGVSRARAVRPAAGGVGGRRRGSRRCLALGRPLGRVGGWCRACAHCPPPAVRALPEAMQAEAFPIGAATPPPPPPLHLLSLSHRCGRTHAL